MHTYIRAYIIRAYICSLIAWCRTYSHRFVRAPRATCGPRDCALPLGVYESGGCGSGRGLPRRTRFAAAFRKSSIAWRTTYWNGWSATRRPHATTQHEQPQAKHANGIDDNEVQVANDTCLSCSCASWWLLMTYVPIRDQDCQFLPETLTRT